MHKTTLLIWVGLSTIISSCENDPKPLVKLKTSFDLPCRLNKSVYSSTIYSVRSGTSTTSKTEFQYEYLDHLKEVNVTRTSTGASPVHYRFKWSYDSSFCLIERGYASVRLKFSDEKKLLGLKYSNGDSYSITYKAEYPFEIVLDSSNRTIFKLFWEDGNIKAGEDYSNPDKPVFHKDLDYSEYFNWNKAELYRFLSSGLTWDAILLFNRNDLKTEHWGGAYGITEEKWNTNSLLTTRIRSISAGNSYYYSTTLDWDCE